MTILILIFTMNSPSFSFLNSCEEKLQRKIWPLDCFLSLNLKNYQEKSAPYALLNEWCSLYESTLVAQEPPEALFSLKIPKTCFKLALKSKEHQMSLKLLKGSFLNSFL